MALNICLVNAYGGKLEELGDTSELSLSDFLPQREEAEFVLLGYIDPYDDTVFNRCQMQRLRPEIQRLIEQTSDPYGICLLQRLDEYAAKCEGAVGMYLKLIGD